MVPAESVVVLFVAETFVCAVEAESELVLLFVQAKIGIPVFGGAE